MTLYGNIGEFLESQESWSQYVQRLEQFFSANDIQEGKQAPVFLATIGPATFHIVSNLVAPRKPGEISYQRLIEVMSDFYNPKPLVTVQRYRFYSRFQHSEETISSFVAELRNLARDCDFGAALEVNLRDKLVCAVADQTLQRKLLSEKDLTFQRALDLAQTHEAARKNVATLHASVDRSGVHQVKSSSVPTPCYRCGRKGHLQTQCKFKTSTCHHCGKIGHIKPVCRSLTSRSSSTSRSNSYSSSSVRSSDPIRPRSFVDSRSPNTSSSTRPRRLNNSDIKTISTDLSKEEEYTLFTVTSSSTGSPLYVTVTVDDIPLTMEVDTGASFSVISKRTYHNNFSHYKLQSTDVKLKTYTGEFLSMYGSFTATVHYQEQVVSLIFIVASDNGPSLLGRNWLHSLCLDWNTILSVKAEHIRLSSLLARYSKVFGEGLGQLKGFKAKLFVDSNTKPVFCKARPVPYSIRSSVEKQLDKLVEQNIIEPVPFSDWAAPIVPIMKQDKTIRICGDFKLTVNTVSKLERYPIPKIEDLFTNLSGGTSFTKLDLSQAYQQLELDNDSKPYTIINTHRGLFKYNRLPFGISSAPAIFQRTMESVLSGIPHVIVYLDDILITGKTEAEHLQNLQLVLQRLEIAGLLLKKNKCEFLVPSITYLGHRIDAQGLHPLPEKIDAIIKAARPESITQLKAFLGLLNYYGKFIPNLSSVLHPLYELLHDKVPWIWTQERDKAFTKAKALLTSDSVLIHFDPNKDIVLACDASAYGIGAVLSHRLPDGSERPIGFTFRTLSPAEQKYSQIEKETLSCVFGVKRYHSYLYGHRFSLITDHKPLLTLLHEHRAIPTTTSNRIQRWALTLSMYEYSISFKSSSSHSNADALSRLLLPDNCREPPVPSETVLLLEQLSESPISVDQIRNWTRKNPVFSRVLQFILSGWPHDLDTSDVILKPFFNRKLELSVQDGVILWGNRVVVPPSGRTSLLQELHACHPGIARMKTLARMFVWWPLLDADIESFVKSCTTCQSQRSSPPPVPIRPWKWPTTPWFRIHLDMAGPFLGHMFLVLIDAHSKWLEVRLMSSTTSTSIISMLRSIFAQFGLPSIIVTDNGRNFTSGEFERFLTQNGIKHLLSSPYHPSSNGLTERGVQIFKREMSKLKVGSLSDRLSHILFYNHITPQSTTGLSPAELLQNRRLRSRLDLIKPDLQARIERRQYEQLNSKSKDRTFTNGDSVYIRNFGNGPKWWPGVVNSAIGNVSYEITLDDSRSFRRHVDDIRQRWNDPMLEVTPGAVTPNHTERLSLSPSRLLVTPHPSIVTSENDTSEHDTRTSENDTSEHDTSEKDTSVQTNTDNELPPIPVNPPDDPSIQNPTSHRYPRRNRHSTNFYSPKDFRRE